MIKTDTRRIIRMSANRLGVDLTAQRRKTALAGVLLALLFSLVAAGCGAPESGERQSGAQVFADNCARCHGAAADGTTLGPPLVHKIYEPGHHPDFSFRNAVKNGVPAHHWDFGDMPPVAGLSDDEVTLIIEYVRGLQRENGIIE